MVKRKICVITGTRAEYGLLRSLIQKINNDNELTLQLVVTGMHLSPEFGYTYKEIENDGFNIDKKVEILMSSDSSIGISKAMGLAQISFSEVFDELEPDIVVILGDRFEMFSVCSAAMIGRIPVAHLYGGEATEGLIDEPIRHSITKMSHIHFTSTKEYENRVIQLGECPETVFNVGAIGLESIDKLNLLSKQSLEEDLGITFKEKNLLITFHSVTLENNTSETHFEELLAVLSNLDDTLLIFTKANADTNGRIINQKIDKYVQSVSNAIVVTSLGYLRYLSCLQFVDGVIGNSSSGIIEVPSFNIGTINIGDRQKGRIQAESIIQCEPNRAAIQKGLNKLYSINFKKQIKALINPYKKNNTASTILTQLKKVELKDILKKKFFDISDKV
jgi:GDP/UDP-N,N'-diacetylbacillosamine 2-epimerase (hydrolysing)